MGRATPRYGEPSTPTNSLPAVVQWALCGRPIPAAPWESAKRGHKERHRPSNRCAHVPPIEWVAHKPTGGRLITRCAAAGAVARRPAHTSAMRTPVPWPLPQVPTRGHDLRAVGITSDKLAGEVRRGTIVRLRRDIYIAASALPDDPRDLHLLRTLAEQTVLTDAVASHHSAALAWRLPLPKWEGRSRGTALVDPGDGTPGHDPVPHRQLLSTARCSPPPPRDDRSLRTSTDDPRTHNGRRRYGTRPAPCAHGRGRRGEGRSK